MNRLTLKLALLALAVSTLNVSVARATITASDDAESYTSWGYGIAGGTGLGAPTYLEGNNGGVYLSTGGEHLDGAKSFGMFASDGGQAYSRSITSPLTAAEYSGTIRFNEANDVAFDGLNIKSSQGSTFGAGELLSWGLRPADGNDRLFVGGLTNQQLILGGEIRGAVVDFDLKYDTTAGTYDLGAKYRASGSYTRITGSLKATGQTASQLGFGVFNTGNGQDMIVDNLQIQSVPEPASLGVLALGGLVFARRRSR